MILLYFSLVFMFDVLWYRMVCVTGPAERVDSGSVVLKISGKYENYEAQSTVLFDYVVSFSEYSFNVLYFEEINKYFAKSKLLVFLSSSHPN